MRTVSVQLPRDSGEPLESLCPSARQDVVGAQKPHSIHHSLRGSDRDGSCKHPRNDCRRPREYTKEYEHDDRLESFCKPSREPDGSLVPVVLPAPLKKGRQREERRSRHVEGEQEDAARQTCVRDGDGNANDEPAVHREVGNHVQKPASVRGTDRPGHWPVQAIQCTISQPQHKRDRPKPESGRHARADTDAPGRRRHRVRRDSRRCKAMPGPC